MKSYLTIICSFLCICIACWCESGFEIQFLGHASFRLNIDGTGIVTDPCFSKRYSILSRRVISEPAAEHFNETQYILISHPHPDHLNLYSINQYPLSCKILCSTSTGRYLDTNHEKIFLEPWQSITMENINITAVPAKHASRRFGVRSHLNGGPLGFIISSGGNAIYYTGDTEIFDAMQAIQEKFHPDLCLANVNIHLPAVDVIKMSQIFFKTKFIPGHHGAYASPFSKRGPIYCDALRENLKDRFIYLEPFQAYPLAGE